MPSFINDDDETWRAYNAFYRQTVKTLMFFFQKRYKDNFLERSHAKNIKCQKCAGMGLNGFILKKINEYWNIKKKNPGSRLGYAC